MNFPTADAIYQYIDQQNLEPIGYIIEQHDHNGTDPGIDYNGTDPGTGGDHNGTQGLPVFALTMNQAETFMGGYAPAHTRLKSSWITKLELSSAFLSVRFS